MKTKKQPKAKKMKIIKSKTSKMKAEKAGKTNVRTNIPSTWCPGCFNFMIQAGVEKFLSSKDLEKEKYAMVTGIGCHAKMFDYLNLPGINALHGRVLPTAFGMKIAKPELNVIAFSGDGDAYAEGMEHTIHMARYNANIKYLVHNNQVFALTVGEPTPLTEKGYRDKTNPIGVKLSPMNPIKLMLAAGCGFVARVFSDVESVNKVLEEASKHKGFCFIEIIQPCIIFHPDVGYKQKLYDLQKSGHDENNWKAAMDKADEWNYDGIKSNTKIPVGIFYKAKEGSLPIFEDIIRK